MTNKSLHVEVKWLPNCDLLVRNEKDGKEGTDRGPFSEGQKKSQNKDNMSMFLCKENVSHVVAVMKDLCLHKVRNFVLSMSRNHINGGIVGNIFCGPLCNDVTRRRPSLPNAATTFDNIWFGTKSCNPKFTLKLDQTSDCCFS